MGSCAAKGKTATPRSRKPISRARPRKSKVDGGFGVNVIAGGRAPYAISRRRVYTTPRGNYALWWSIPKAGVGGPSLPRAHQFFCPLRFAAGGFLPAAPSGQTGEM